MTGTFGEVFGPRSQTHSEPGHAPPVNRWGGIGAKNNHISQRFKSGQAGYQIVPLVHLIILIYLFMGL